MTVQEQIAARLAEFAEVYEEIGTLRQELAVLQQADVAQAEYIEKTSEFDEEIRTLTLKQKQLEAPQRKAPIIDAGLRDFRPVVKPAPDRYRFEIKDIATPTSGNQQPLHTARTDLKKLVGRWGRFWKLTGETQGRINRIADDPARPLGEALALLDWTTFENRIGSSEDEETHLARIVSWGTALVEYRERLFGDIEMLKTKYRLVMPILEIWLKRNTADGRKSWEEQISETKAEKEKEVERLRMEIARLSADG